jgi:hypothetical protein
MAIAAERVFEDRVKGDAHTVAFEYVACMQDPRYRQGTHGRAFSMASNTGMLNTVIASSGVTRSDAQGRYLIIRPIALVWSPGCNQDQGPIVQFERHCHN